MWSILADAISRFLPEQRNILYLGFALAEPYRLAEAAAPACYTDLVPKRNETRRHVSRSLGATMTVLLLLAVMRGAWAQTSPTEYCRQIGTDDTVRSVPPSLVCAVLRLFQLETMPSAQVERSTYFRCTEGHVFVCTVGANLVCGKADTRRDLPGVKAWCAEHEGSQPLSPPRR